MTKWKYGLSMIFALAIFNGVTISGAPETASKSYGTVVSDAFDDGKLDSKWILKDIGKIIEGKAEEVDGELRISTGGKDIYEVEDQFRYVCQWIDGDFSVTLKVKSLPGKDPE